MPLEDGNLKIVTLKEFVDVLNSENECVRSIENKSSGFLVFADPSDLLNNPGWPLRNLLYLVLMHW